MKNQKIVDNKMWWKRIPWSGVVPGLMPVLGLGLSLSGLGLVPGLLGVVLGLLVVALVVILRYRPRTASPSRTAHRTRLPEQPPELAAYLLRFLPKKDREAIIGDLEEEYTIVYRRFGLRKADRWFYWQVLASFWPSFKRAIVQLGALHWLGEVFRRFIS